VENSALSTARSASALLASLGDAELALARGSLDDPQLTEWSYLPGDRPGLPVERLKSGQHDLVLELLRSAHSPEGADLAFGALEVERVRRELANGSRPDGDRYWVRVLGDPGGDAPWGWRINGHHLAVHVVVAGDTFTITPHFLGSEPARVPTGGRLLGLEEDLARDLATSLDPEQRRLGVVAERAPDDILTRHDPVADPDLLPAGIARDLLRPDQCDLLDRLVRRYLDRAPRDYAEHCWAEAQENADRIRFAWAGPTEPGQGHYYCVTTPDFLIEYDNTQDEANHAHSVWRHLRDDWGVDLLRAHYAQAHGE
jgi:hypothetical protein